MTANEYGVTEANINVDSIKIAILGTLNWLPPWGFVNGRACAKRFGEFTSTNPFATVGDLQKLLIS